MAPPKTHRLSEVLCDFGGKKISGYGDDETFSLAPKEAVASSLEGGDGEVVVSMMSSEMGEVTITVLQTSDANDVFQDQLDAQKRGPGIPYKRLTIRNLNGRAKHIFPHCWVQARPTVVYGKSARAHAWVIGYAAELPGGIRGSAGAT